MIPVIALISVAFASNAIIVSVPPGINCPSDSSIVCGNGKNYLNECVAIANGITSFVKEACLDDCFGPYDPVCGSDGKTYSNKCSANKAGITTFVKGSCDPGCTKEFVQVCDNNKTYDNKCLAKAAGNTLWVNGPCLTNPTAPTTQPSAQATIGVGIYSSASYNEASFSLLSLLLLLA
jgi:hypothetical protein